jgi:sulfur transfer complex TusBCD TusB component (DsrH family)
MLGNVVFECRWETVEIGIERLASEKDKPTFWHNGLYVAIEDRSKGPLLRQFSRIFGVSS